MKSPITVRTRFRGDYINIQDLQSQLYRDKDQVNHPAIADYIRELIERLDGIKGDKGSY